MGLNYRSITKYLGVILCYLGIVMIPSVIVGLIYGEMHEIQVFLTVAAAVFLVGLCMYTPQRHHKHTTGVGIREGFFVVAITWIVFGLVGSLPFYISGAIPSYIDAVFEACSGFSTTGASILTDIEVLPKSILFWRSFAHWLGGMGILVFAIAFMPEMSTHTQSISYAETTGPTIQKLSSHATETSRILYAFYTGFTILEIIILKFAGMNWFDSIIHSFGSVGTGGFSNYNDSLMHFDSVPIYIIVTIFMLLSGVNFNLYYLSLRNGLKAFTRDAEFKFYILIITVATIFIGTSIFLSGKYDTVGESALQSLFQTVSIITTTGFCTADFDLWPTFAKFTLFCLFFIGGCTSSTGGGPKVLRVMVMLKLLKRSLAIRLHPHAVVEIKVGGKPIPNDMVSGIANFTFLYIGILFLSTILISLNDFSFTTNISAVASCIGNIGPGFDMVGPVLNYSAFAPATKILLSFLMILGRLELFTVLMLFSPKYWNPNKH